MYHVQSSVPGRRPSEGALQDGLAPLQPEAEGRRDAASHRRKLPEESSGTKSAGTNLNWRRRLCSIFYKEDTKYHTALLRTVIKVQRKSVVAKYDCELLYLQPCAFLKNYLTTRLS